MSLLLPRISAASLLLVGLFASPGLARQPRAGEVEFFEKSVRPVLVERCLSCHGAEKAKGGLRLDTRAGLLAGGDGGPVLTPGKPAESRLLAALRHTGELKMPPSGKLPARELAALEKWIELGAPWPDAARLAAPDAIAKAAAAHWAFRPVQRPAVPVLPDANSSHPIDRFIQTRLRATQLRLSPRADRRTLIRRATFDLHGVPPTPEEIDAFIADPDPNAYPKLIDRLLASPRYGERWARHWLDVARYADNKGYVFFEGKEYPWAWTYRDYVIDAFNRDLPFDRFVMEQLAADRLAPTDTRAQAALGFLTIGGHFMNNTHDIIDDRIDVVTRGFLGLTVSCARCHDHKFDPIPSTDYYSLYGVFRSSFEPTVPPLRDAAPADPDYQLYEAELRLREQRLVEFVTRKHAGLVFDARWRINDYLLAAHAARNHPPADDFMLLADPGDLNPSMITRWRQHLADAKTRRDPVWRHWHAFAELPEADFATKSAAILASIDGGNRYVQAEFTTPPRSMTDVANRYGALFRSLAMTHATVPHRVGADPELDQLLRVLYGAEAPADAPLELDWGFLSLFPDRATQGQYQTLLRSLETWLAKGPPRAMVLLDAERPFAPRVFERGHPGRPGERVPRQFLTIANPQRQPFGAGSGRLELAREIVARSNPLTARVFVNRVWMHHFGKPLVGTPGDFGLRGDPPTHPELLDWLAAEFMESWSLKQLHRQIMTSAAYMQSSQEHAEGVARDAENRGLWRMNRRRLEFEALHDALLAVAGQLDVALGGPPVRLFGGNRRRAVYGYVDRLEFPSLLTTFDVPNPAGSTAERTPTTVAPQALFLMNGPFARAAAKQLVARPDVRTAAEPTRRLDRIFRIVLGRTPDDEERKLALAFVARGPGDERWIDLVHGLLMTNEFCFVD